MAFPALILALAIMAVAGAALHNIILALIVLLFPAAARVVRSQALVGALFSGVAAYLSTKFLLKFFETRSLLPFGVYCLVAGGLCILRFA